MTANAPYLLSRAKSHSQTCATRTPQRPAAEDVNLPRSNAVSLVWIPTFRLDPDVSFYRAAFICDVSA